MPRLDAGVHSSLMHRAYVCGCVSFGLYSFISFEATVPNAPSARMVCFANTFVPSAMLTPIIVLLLTIKSVMPLPTWILTPSCSDFRHIFEHSSFIDNSKAPAFPTLLASRQLMSKALVSVKRIMRSLSISTLELKLYCLAYFLYALF